MGQETVSNYYQADHDRLEKIFLEFKNLKGSDLSKAREHFSNYKAGLEHHILWEENILFPAFEAKTEIKGSRPTEVMRKEHVQIKDIILRIQEELKKENPETEILEASLVSILSNHHIKEDHILYPGIDNLLNEEETIEIFKKMDAI